jgi:hypothetical protein
VRSGRQLCPLILILVIHVVTDSTGSDAYGRQQKTAAAKSIVDC